MASYLHRVQELWNLGGRTLDLLGSMLLDEEAADASHRHR